MIQHGTKFNFDGRDWLVEIITTVKYVNYQGYVVTVDATAMNDMFDVRYIDLLANGTPLGYTKV